MPLNLLKTYSELLDLNSFCEYKRKNSLKGIFDRDILNNGNFSFDKKKIKPTTAEGQDAMERLFTHLTTTITDKETNKREFDMSRSVRLHWIKYHIERNKTKNVLVFSIAENGTKRTYIYDKDEKYVIILEPLRNKNEYYLLTAYYIEGKDNKRDKIMKKYNRRLPEVL